MSVTVAPGTTPPCASLTVPMTFPVVICAEAGTAVAPANNNRAAIDCKNAVRLVFLTHPPRRPGLRTAGRCDLKRGEATTPPERVSSTFAQGPPPGYVFREVATRNAARRPGRAASR